MKSTLTPRFSIKRLFLLTLVSLVAVVALLGIAGSANKANRAEKALEDREAEFAASKPAIVKNSIAPQPLAPLAPGITATLTDNTLQATKVAPGATVNYTAVIGNAGVSPADDALTANFNAPLDTNTTIIAGTVHASPIAFNDTYNWVGNTQLDTSARALSTVTANDVAVNASLPALGTDTFNVVTQTNAPTALAGGLVTLAANGHFVYTPPVGRPSLADGISVNDSFTYQITNSADATLVGTGTVTINLTGRVWYLQAGAAGDGRSNTPSGSPSAMSTSADKTSDIFYIFSGGGSLNGLFTLDNSQQLLGQGVALVVNTITLFTATSNPTTTNTTGNGVTLGLNNILSGFNIGNCSGNAIFGSSVGTLTINTLSINTTGAGLDLTGVSTPTVSIVLGGLTSTGGTKNVNLVGLNGTVTLAGGTLSGAAGNAFDVTGAGTANITYSGTISNTAAARLINISGKTGGTVAFSGAMSGTGSSTGINLTTNTGATINFTGGINLSTGVNAAFTATGGGTVSATQNNTTIVNTLTTTTGTALNVVNTTIGASNVTFRLISSNGASSGIVLNNTGSSGGLIVTGNSAGNCGGVVTPNAVGTPATITTPVLADCTGGSILNSTSDGVSLNSTANVSLTRMRIQDSGDSGVFGNNVTGFSLISSWVESNGDTTVAEDSGLEFQVLTGTNNVTNSTISNSFEHSINWQPTSGTGTLNISGTTIGPNPVGTGANGVHFNNSTGTVNSTIIVTNSNIDGNQATGFQGNAGGVGGTSTQNFKVSNTTIKNNNIAIQLTSDTDADTNFNITNNTIIDHANFAIGLIPVSTSTNNSQFQGSISGNVIGDGSVDSGSRDAYGIRGDIRGDVDAIVSITNNTIRNTDIEAIFIEGRLDNDADAQNGLLDVTVTGNDGFAPDDNSAFPFFAVYGARIESRNTFNVCLDFGGSAALSNDAVGIGGFEDWRLRQRDTSTFRLERFVGSGTVDTNVESFMLGQNPDLSTADATHATTYTGVANGTCRSPVIPPGIAMNLNPFYTDSVMLASNAPTAPPVVAKQAVAKAPESVAAVKQFTRTANNPLMAVNAVRSNKTNRSDARLSHHAVRSNTKPYLNAPNMVVAGETINVPIGTLPAGKSITIKYSATVNTPPLARQMSTQGTVSGGNFGSVLTDDPDAVGATNPTVTLIDTLVTWNGGTNTDWNTASNWTVPGGASYAPGVSNPAVNDVVIPNVGNQPNISATDIGIYSLNIANGRTLTITSPRVLTIGGSPGGDLTLDGIISGGNLNLGTGTHVINNAGGTGSIVGGNQATVLSGSTVTLNNNLQMSSLTVNAGGSMNITNRTLSVNGSGAALAVAGGATFTIPGSTVVFNGTAAQQAAGTNYANMTINNSIGLNVTGVTLTGNASVGTLVLTSSDLDTGAFTLTQASIGISSGVSDVVGTVKRSSGGIGLPPGVALTFGNPNNRITFTGGAPNDATVVLTKAAPATYAAAVQRNYVISHVGGAGFTSATVRLRYLDPEVTGLNTEATLNLRRLRTSDGHWVAQLPTVRDTAANWVESNAVAAADLPTQWTFSSLAPTASDGVVTGRIVAANGTPVEGAVVRLSGTQNRKLITDANGFYRFENVETNGFYTVTPARVNFSFSPSQRSFSQLGSNTEAGFTGSSAGDSANPLDTAEYFVRQQYVDLLGREPDEGGFNYWSDRILECDSDAICVNSRRRDVAAAFFIEQEFQRTGSFIYGLYKGSLSRRPGYAEFSADRRQVVEGPTLEAMKQALAESFVSRAEFTSKYQGNNSAESFVDALLGTVSQSSGIDLSNQRANLIGRYQAGANLVQSRSFVLRDVIDNAGVQAAEYNRAFVLAEYFGYLQRDPDQGGYDFWLDVVSNRDVGNYRSMVCAFISSPEYQRRFSSIVSRNDGECGQ